MPWEYRFYLDLQASIHESKIGAALNELRRCVEEVRVLGCYPAADQTSLNETKTRSKTARSGVPK
jgi:prephenate dehydratase